MAAQMANLRACPCQAPAGAAAADKAWRDSRSTSSAFWRHSNPQQQNWSTLGVQIKSSSSPPLVRVRGRHNSSVPQGGMAWRSGLHSTAHDSEEEEEFQDELREECGVVGVMGSPEASRLCHLALHALQHRGQEGAGIAAADGGSINAVRGTGLVAEVFDDPGKLEALPGACAIGHVRYATSGASALENVQPFVATTASGPVAVAHNGNIVNAGELRARLEETGSIFTTSSDTEVVLHLMAARSAGGRPFLARVVEACEQLQGAYSMVFLGADQLVAVRDPHGFRPLVMGRLSGSQVVVFASETCALDLLGAVLEREVNPGEAVVVDAQGHVTSLCLLLPKHERRPARCVFELIYFASPASQVFGRSVYASRAQYGAVLAEEAPAPCDVVVAVPDSGVPTAIGYAARAGVPYQPGLLRSHYVGRTFIQPSQELRDLGVKMKLAAVREVVAGKRVVVVDDSIVRGTTSSKIVRLLRDAGATEVHMRIASPPIVASCYYGVDTPCRDELISYRLSVEETRRQIGADTLAFLPLERLKALGGEESGSFCYACFSGNYPVLTTAMVKKEAATLVGPEVLATAAAAAAARSNPLRQLFSSEQQQQQPSKPAVAA